jgi:predicted TIM-barrel fold metal-dependent hydrolase
MIVDVHAHCYPKAYVAELMKMGKGDEGGIGIKIPQWSSTDERLQMMSDFGIDVQVLGLSAPNVYFQDAEASKSLAQMTNDFIAEVCKKHPNRFLGLASVPLNNLNDAFDELDRSMNNLKMDGVTLGTNINKKSLAHKQFLPLLEELDKRRIPVALHPMKAIGEELMLEEDVKLAIPSNVGFIFETTRTIAQMLFRGTFEKLKNLTFILPHSGGSIPFLYPRWEMSYRSRPNTHPLKKIPNLPGHYLKKHYYDTALSYYHSSLRCTLDLAGADHVVFGTDFPYTTDFRSKETIEKIETYEFSEEEKEKIFYQNAARLFPRLKSTSER